MPWEKSLNLYMEISPFVWASPSQAPRYSMDSFVKCWCDRYYNCLAWLWLPGPLWGLQISLKYTGMYWRVNKKHWNRYPKSFAICASLFFFFFLTFSLRCLKDKWLRVTWISKASERGLGSDLVYVWPDGWLWAACFPPLGFYFLNLENYEIFLDDFWSLFCLWYSWL